MKRKYWLPLIILLAVGLTAGAASADYLVGLSHGTDKQRPEYSFTSNDTFALQAAGNEWEPFAVLIRDDQGLTNVNVEVSEFTGPGDPIDEIEPYRAAYVPVPAEHISHVPPDPDMAGDWPDGLIPFVDHFTGETRDGAPFDLAANYTQMIFVDVFIPEGQEPGTYTATVTVTADDRADWTGTVTLEVWDFTLPTGISLASNYGWSLSTVYNWHQAHGGVTDRATLNTRYLQEFARHRMALYGWNTKSPAYTWNDTNQTFDWDWTEFDTVDGPVLDGTFYRPGYKFTGLTLPGAPGGCPGTVDPVVWEREYWKGWAQHFRDRGWNDVLWYYMPDEPRPEMYPALRELAARLHAADPDLQPLVTEQFEEDLAGDVDIWCPDEPFFSDSMPYPPFPEVYEERRALGEKTWWYNCVSATILLDFASHAVDAESSYMRIWPWLTRRYHFTGILFWHTVYVIGQGHDPWESMYASPFFQGDGSVIYPGTIDHIGGETDIPVASLRMKYLREGMEDYEYFHLLDNQGDAEWVDAVTRTVGPKSYVWEHDWSTLLNWRERVAQRILGTSDDTPPAPPTNLTAAGVANGVELTWTKPTAPDLAGYEFWYGLYEGDAFFGGSIDNAAATSAVIDGLMPGREYLLWVKAFDESGNRSADSEVVTATPTEGDDDAGKPDDDGGDDDAGGGDTGSDDDDQGNRNGVNVAEKSADDSDSASGCGGW
ncbi:MAG: DUF4091 domain-containing protein [Myxococcales bacterium]|nr:DUF4091 domain-containing protein [Myxococcales bacterium]